MTKLRNPKEDELICHACGSVELILWQCPFYHKRSTDSIKSSSKFFHNSSQKVKK